MNRTLRFSELRKQVPKATPKMLTQQLRELEQDGLVPHNERKVAGTDTSSPLQLGKDLS